MCEITFAYNSTPTIPGAGSQRRTFSVAWADSLGYRVHRVEHEIYDFSNDPDVIGRRKQLHFVLRPDIMLDETDRLFFQRFYASRHQRAEYGNFRDTDNMANLCKRQTIDGAVTDLRVETDLEGE